ncbi:hypothetical protein KIH31_09290 [Paenarthrobacter sp. DKR-5]|uniref:FliH/SctL family protein n=1 Tax=Paenarthrobacter sp. DKR-5 TaxID=2835535 RepID=UPI001BDBCA2B|nr:FliH/SctL family protein [Paenarthrobacter sp. DKR-5]MBT1002799.1 hypothetical protein [Paenarthrobacter sp. DKR-5]
MTLSTEAAYSAARFPVLKAPAAPAPSAQGYTQGHAAGYTAGLRAATAEQAARLSEMEAEHAAMLRHLQAKTDRVLASLAAAAEALDAAVLPVVEYAQDTLVDAALELAESILGYELSDADTSARAAVARALAEPVPPGVHTVRLHPADLAVLDQATLQRAGVAFAADESLQRGDAVAEFASGYVDARIGSALGRVRAALQEDRA